MNILVAYASAHGSTAEVGTFVGRTLQAYNTQITVAHVDEVESIDQYDAFILGSAVHSSMWLPSLSRFMFRFESELAQKPIYLFLMCVLVLEEGGREKALSSYVWKEALERLNLPREHIEAFAGKLDWSNINGDERWLISTRYEGDEVPTSSTGEYRDWQRIASWVNSVAHELEIPLDLSESPSISKKTKEETITEEEVENLSWVDNPGEISAI